MLFKSRFWPGLADGSITLTFRRWKRAQAVAGGVHRTAAGRIAVDSVTIVDSRGISDAEAMMAGYDSAAALNADLRGNDELPLYRVVFHLLDEPDPRDELAAREAFSAEEARQLTSRLARLDSASPSGPWTLATLRLIAERPGVRAAELAAALGRETPSFKQDVRKLKSLGLTVSLETGYRLSPRGAALLERVEGARAD
jgi:hypothetical protein